MADRDTRAIDATELADLFQGLARFRVIYLAVSGGADSMALMHLVAQWRAIAGLKSPEVRVLTVDHGLRAEAAAEADQVVVEAQGLGLAAETLTWQGVKPASGLQEAAREARYELMFSHILETSPDPAEAVLVTAHHRDDTAETLLMRLARGAGVDGLASIQAFSHRGAVAMVRPLLDIPKSRLQVTLRAAGLSWVEDPSNQNQMFERVQLRGAMAERAALGLDDAALALTARRMARARQALDDATTDWLAPRLQDPQLVRTGVFVWRGGYENVADEIAIRALMRLLPMIGGVAQPPRLLRTERLWDDMQHGDFAGATLGNCVVRPGRDGDICIYREPERGSLPDIETQSGQVLVWDNRFEIAVGETGSDGVRVRPLGLPDLETFMFDARAEGLPFPVEALQATPVLADADGLLAIPALNMHRNDPKALAAAQLSCRLIIERGDH